MQFVIRWSTIGKEKFLFWTELVHGNYEVYNYYNVLFINLHQSNCGGRHRLGVWPHQSL